MGENDPSLSTILSPQTPPVSGKGGVKIEKQV
jgi:hypothetical protein